MTHARFVFLGVIGSAFLAACGGSTSDTIPAMAGGAAGAATGTGGASAGTSAAGGTAGGAAGTTTGKGGSAGVGTGGMGGAAAGKGGSSGATAGTGGAASAGKGGSTAGGPGQGGSATAGTTGTAGAAGSASTTCSDCVATSCPTQAADCQADAKCDAFVTCVQSTCNGGGGQCLFQCAASAGITSPMDPSAVKGQALLQCGAMNCSTECGATTGAGGSGAGGFGGKGGGGFGGGTMNQCMQAAQSCFFQGPCGKEGAACFQTPGCQQCIQDGGTGTTCPKNKAYQALQTCTCANAAACMSCCF